ncbi:MAG: glycerophosphodiester phosphodiesterase [Candidatus Rokubacteria bacterium]|nr:glycerophosphodiester phosphodiesterase [Candidatus Rokubacteria bacterium]
MTRPLVAAHRGGALLWPENSLLAFRGAIALGAPAVELDVHLARDGGVVVIHDRTLDRTTEGAGPVADRTTDELRRLRLRDRSGTLTDERVPALDAVLSVIAPSTASLLLEVKGPGPAVCYERADHGIRAVSGPRYEGLEERLLALVAAAGLESRTTVMAFNPDVVRRVRTLAPGTRTTLLVARAHLEAPRATVDDVLAFAAGLGVTDLGLEHTLADEALVDAVRRRGLRLGVWTVDDPALIRRYAALGVDVITSDRPDVALEALGAAGARSRA